MSNFGPLPYKKAAAPLRRYQGGGFGAISSPQNPTKFLPTFLGNGLYTPILASTDLYMVADDAGGSSWASRVGSQSAVRTGTPDANIETPLYPNALYAGVGYRKAVRMTGADYYTIPPNAANDLNSTSQTTYDVTLMVGSNGAAEIVLYNDSSVGYNFYLAVLGGGSAPIIEARVSHTGSDAVCQYACSRFCLYKVKLTYTGSTKTLTMSINGIAETSSAGTGTINSGGGVQGLGIGGIGGANPLQTSALIEFIRYQTVISDATWFNQVNYFMGMVDSKGNYPNYYVRTTKAAVYVNNKLWQFGPYLPRTTDKGYLSEYDYTNVLQNSTFTEPLGTGFTQAASGAGLSYQVDAEDNKTVGGIGLRIDNDIAGIEKGVYWTSAFVGADVKCWAYAEWKAISGAGVAYFQIYNMTTGRYYNKTTQTWQASPFYIALGATSATKVKTDFFFNNDSTGGAIFFFACNGAQANTTSCMFFHVQFMPAYDVVTQPFVYEGLSGGSSFQNEALYYPSANNINFARGKMTFDFTSQKSSAEVTTATKLGVFGLDGNVVFIPASSGSFSLTDGTNTCTISPTYARNQTLSFTLTWGGSSMSISESTSGLSATAAFSGTLGGNNFLGLGQALFIDGKQPYGYFKNIRIS